MRSNDAESATLLLLLLLPAPTATAAAVAGSTAASSTGAAGADAGAAGLSTMVAPWPPPLLVLRRYSTRERRPWARKRYSGGVDACCGCCCRPAPGPLPSRSSSEEL